VIDAPQPQPLDPGNTLFAETPAALTVALMQTKEGQRLLVTTRTASTTLSVLLSAADAKTWASLLSGTADQMSTSGLIVAAPGLPATGKM
jgi:hypothetical protein